MDATKLLGCALACLSLFITPAAAQQFPSKVVKLVVPQTPGGATDVFARKIGQALSEKWGQPVIVENRAGAGGVVGTDVVAKSAPDGYTLLVTYAGSQAINASLYPKIPFDTVKDFRTIATLASTPFVLIVHPKLPAKDLAEFIALARARPDALTYASSGNGSVNHLLGEMLKTDAAIKMLHVPYRGVAPAITDVIAGQVDSAFSSVPSVLQMVQSDKVRALAVSSARRISAAPEIPTIAESGVPAFQTTAWFALWGPPNLPPDIVKKIHNDVSKALDLPQTRDFFKSNSFERVDLSPADFGALIESDLKHWTRLINAVGAKIE